MVDRLEHEESLDIEQRRHRVASWIQSELQPVDRLMKYDDLFPDGNTAFVGYSDTKTGSTPTTEFEPREYQLDAWAALWQARQDGANRGLIHMATGLGKTNVAVFDAMKFRKEFNEQHGHNPKILFTVHQNAILDNAAERFATFMPDATQGFYNGEGKDDSADITFATLQSLYANLDNLDPETFDYIIDDEVHHTKADTYEKVVHHFKPAFRLGLTATPDRADERDIRDLYGAELYSKGLAEALSEGWLATPDYHIVFDDAVKEAMRSGFQPNSLRALKELFSVKPRNDTIADNIREEMKKIGLEFGSVKTIVFCQDIEHAEEMAELLGGKAYHSETDNEDRKDVFAEFKYGDLQIITTRDMFNEGVDVPDARLLVFLRSTSSQTIFEQQLGRGLRKTEGKERVSILDFVANVERIAIVKDLAEQVKKPGKAGNGEESPNGEGDIISDDVFEPIEDGFAIYTNNGEFDFDTMVVDLLEKYQVLSARDLLKFAQLSNESIVALAMAISPDKPLTFSEMNNLGKERTFPSAGTIVNRFGSITAFQKACGFEFTKYDDTDAIIELALQLSPDQPLTGSAIDKLRTQGAEIPSANVIARLFGGLIAFQEACGFEVQQLANMGKDEIIELAHRLSPEKPMGTDEIAKLSKRGDFVSMTTITKKFGNISAFQEACGFNAVKRGMSDGEIITLALQLSPDIPLSAKKVEELNKDGLFLGRDAIRLRFGSVAKFQEACGFEVTQVARRKPINFGSNEDVVTLAKELSPDNALSTAAIKELSKAGKFISVSAIYGRFGNMVAFQEACGW